MVKQEERLNKVDHLLKINHEQVKSVEQESDL